MASRTLPHPDPELIAFVRALARADAEEDIQRRLAKRRQESGQAS